MNRDNHDNNLWCLMADEKTTQPHPTNKPNPNPNQSVAYITRLEDLRKENNELKKIKTEIMPKYEAQIQELQACKEHIQHLRSVLHKIRFGAMHGILVAAFPSVAKFIDTEVKASTTKFKF